LFVNDAIVPALLPVPEFVTAPAVPPVKLWNVAELLTAALMAAEFSTSPVAVIVTNPPIVPAPLFVSVPPETPAVPVIAPVLPKVPAVLVNDAIVPALVAVPEFVTP
jgi:hypothetical protein